MEDMKIIELYLERKENAIIETKNKYNTYLMNIADNILHDYFENEECVNDTYLKTWENIPPTIPVSLKAYVGKITRNNALNRVRDKKRDKRVINYISEQLNELESVLIVQNKVEDEVENKRIEEILKQFLIELTLEKRVIFIRRYWYFDSIKELSDRMSINENNIKAILKRIRDKLRKRLEEEGVL